MKVLIVEDEALAAEKLTRYLDRVSKEVEVLNTLSSLKLSIPWLMNHQDEVDVIFMDIQLQDGLSFEIFSQVKVVKPVIFTTAFDEYAIDAFKVNSIDYLLKPISFTALNQALDKYESMKTQFMDSKLIQKVSQTIKKHKFKSRFLVKTGNHIKSVLTSNVAYFFAEGRDVHLVSVGGKKYIIDFTLEELEEFMDETKFFRLNRSIIVNILSIKDVIVYSNRRLKLLLEPAFIREVVVARERVSSFKKWLEGGE